MYNLHRRINGGFFSKIRILYWEKQGPLRKAKIDSFRRKQGINKSSCLDDNVFVKFRQRPNLKTMKDRRLRFIAAE